MILKFSRVPYVVVASDPVGFPDKYDSISGARNCPFNQKQIVFRAYVYDLKAHGGNALVALLAGHLFPLDDSTGESGVTR